MREFDVLRLVYRLIPPFQRTRNDGTTSYRVTWLWYLCKPLVTLYSTYKARREYNLSLANGYSVATIAKILQRDIDDNITITSETGEGLVIYSLVDSEPGTVIYSLDDGEPGKSIPSIADMTYIGDIVNVPDANDNDSVVAIIERHRMIGTQYLIQN